VARLADDWVVPGGPGNDAPGGGGRWNTTAFPAVHPTAPGYTDATYYFHIRENVPWHDEGTYGNVTPADVEYSFERWMAFDRSGGPAWMIFEPLLDSHYADWDNVNQAQEIDDAVGRNDTTGWVWFNLMAVNYPTMIFMQVVAQQWASIIDQDWATAHGCWPGTNKTNANMEIYYDPSVSPLDDWPSGTGGKVEMGSGPYTLDTFDSLGQWYRLQYFPDYWQGWPAPNCDDYIRTYTMRGIEEWGTRKSMFLAGDADFCYVPRAHIVELILNWPSTPEQYAPGLDCLPDLPNVAWTPSSQYSTCPLKTTPTWE
jgi:peptide/nickel transport system substrate-binding protein